MFVNNSSRYTDEKGGIALPYAVCGERLRTINPKGADPMKIEKVSENQIRCTLTKEDLASRELKISELAYGTEKAKNLFRDMMQQANFEFGFEAEDIPLMIEAIPMNAECIVLIITKVEDPEELDTRFARFAPSVHEELEEEDSAADEVLDLFRRLQGSEDVSSPLVADAEISEDTESPLLMRMLKFHSLHRLLTAATTVSWDITGTSSLYRDAKEDCYLLLLTHPQKEASGFNKCCNALSEYGSFLKVLPSTPSYLEEHCEAVISENALQTLSKI